jgi:hypothetical protein
MSVFGHNHCVFHAGFRGGTPPLWTFLSSRRIDDIRQPTAEEEAEFSRLNTDCVVQGDDNGGRELPCTRPESLARRGRLLHPKEGVYFTHSSRSLLCSSLGGPE